MEILMYGWEYPPMISGGLGMACYGIASALAKKNVKINFVLPFINQEMLQHDNVSLFECGTNSFREINNIEESFFQEEIKKFRFALNPYQTSSIDSILKNQSVLLASNQINHLTNKLSGKYDNNLMQEVHQYTLLACQLAKWVPHDIIHAHDWITAIAGINASRISGKPLVLHIHSLEPDRNGDHLNQTIYDIERYAMNAANKIVSVSHYTKAIIKNHYGILDEKIEVVHNGIFNYINEPNDLLAKPGFKIVLFLGRITHQKGPIYFIRAAEKVLSKRQDIKFVIAGEGDQIRQMIDEVARLDLGKNILFTGFLNQKKVRQILSISDVYVMPSTSEPFGLSCLEALSHRVPVIISKQSGVSEVIRHAFKANFWDVTDIASKIIALLDYDVLRKEQVDNAIKEMRSLKWEDTATKLINLYSKL